MRQTLPEAPFPDNSFRRNPIHIPNLALQAQRRAEAEALGISSDGLSPKLQSLENALNKLLGGSYKFESLTGERPLNKKNNPLKNLDDAKGKAGNQQQQQGQQQQQQNAATGSLADLLADMDVGTPIRTEDGEEVYVQVIDLDDAGDLQGEELIRKVQEALAGKGKSKRKSKKEEKEKEEEEEELYADEVFYFEDW
ncbi:hypothetical protein FRC00_012023 [Tulasnella sp. 408]|nr:hypothetical protein FRC00_012023 [Tulasnella sp. 408]